MSLSTEQRLFVQRDIGHDDGRMGASRLSNVSHRCKDCARLGSLRVGGQWTSRGGCVTLAHARWRNRGPSLACLATSRSISHFNVLDHRDHHCSLLCARRMLVLRATSEDAVDGWLWTKQSCNVSVDNFSTPVLGPRMRRAYVAKAVLKQGSQPVGARRAVSALVMRAVCLCWTR